MFTNSRVAQTRATIATGTVARRRLNAADRHCLRASTITNPKSGKRNERKNPPEVKLTMIV